MGFYILIIKKFQIVYNVDMKKILILLLVACTPSISVGGVLIENAKKVTAGDVAIVNFDLIEKIPVQQNHEHLYKTYRVPNAEPYTEQSGESLIQINADDIRDINWRTALDMSDPASRPEPIILPFLQDFPIEMLEVKFKFLRHKF